MPHYYVVCRTAEADYYLTPRRTVKTYMARSSWSTNKDDARVFNTRSAAANAVKFAKDYIGEGTIFFQEFILP
jgi:hypothetical protein